MYVSVIKNVSLKYEAGGPRVERFFKEPLSTPTEVFYFNLEVLKFQFGGEIKIFLLFHRRFCHFSRFCVSASFGVISARKISPCHFSRIFVYSCT